MLAEIIPVHSHHFLLHRRQGAEHWRFVEFAAGLGAGFAEARAPKSGLVVGKQAVRLTV